MTTALTHSNFFMLQKWWQGTDRTYIHSKLFIPFVVLFPCFSVCSATFTNAIQPIVWQWYLGKSWVTWAISRIQCKVFAYSDVCYKPPSVPLCCSFLVFCLLTGCIDHNIRRLLEPRVASPELSWSGSTVSAQLDQSCLNLSSLGIALWRKLTPSQPDSVKSVLSCIRFPFWLMELPYGKQDTHNCGMEGQRGKVSAV